MAFIRKIKAALVPIELEDYVGEEHYIFHDIETGELRIWDGTPGGTPIFVPGGGGGGDPDQNLWETITSDAGSAVANTITDTLTIAGGTGIDTAISGDTLTITATGSIVVDMAHLVYVAINGNDTTGDGTSHNPFLSIGKALTDITDNSNTNRYTILVASGTYTMANPIVCKPFVNIHGIGEAFSTKITPVTASSNIFDVSANDISISNLVLDGATTAAGVFHSGTGVVSLLALFLVNCQVAINATNGIMFMDDIVISPLNPTMTSVFDMSGGSQYLNNFKFVSGATITNVILLSGGADFHIIGAFHVEGANATNGFNLTGASTLSGQNVYLSGMTNAIVIDGASEVDMASLTALGATLDIWVKDLASEIHVYSGELSRDRVSFPNGYVNDVMSFIDETAADSGLAVWGEFAVGRPERGSETIFGEGDSYVRGMNVLTSDGTATSTTEGGNITDITSDVNTVSAGTGAFQGVTANHCIYIGSELNDGTDELKHWGIKVSQTTAAVEVTPKSFVFEIWDGAAWVEAHIMATESNAFHRYSNCLFIRANSIEHIRYGLVNANTWVKKAINAKTLYWIRIRIETTITTSPVFNQFKLHSSRSEANIDGTMTYHGLSRYRKTLLATGNVFGESGGILSASPTVGTAGLPTGWTHYMKNTRLNKGGDAIYFQMGLPRGIDTSHPVRIVVLYHPITAGASSDSSFIISALPMEVTGNLVCDPAGSTIPITRTLANTTTKITDAGQSFTISVPSVENEKIQSFTSGDIIISDFYEGDLMAMRVEMDALGDGSKDITIWGVEVSGVLWTLGEKL